VPKPGLLGFVGKHIVETGTPSTEAWGHGAGSCFLHQVFLDVKASTTMDSTLIRADFLFESRYSVYRNTQNLLICFHFSSLS
jgi:hypothetical protein